MIVHRLAWIALLSLILLVVAGATVRVTGSGLGCPDWPTCWGCLIPPTNVDQIDVNKLDLEKFKKHAARKGIDPDTITRETILDSFDPVRTWIEFTNRLASLPLGFATLFLFLFSLGGKHPANGKKIWIVGLSFFCLADVIANAIMGAMVVRSGLQPGIITLHMALAFLLIAVLVTLIWMSRPETAPQTISRQQRVGSQLREQTDELTMAAETEEGIEREDWTKQLSATIIFKIHRSFSWTLLLTSGLMFYWVARDKTWSVSEPKLIFGMVIAMMLMGIVLGHIKIYPIVQVLHVAMTSVLLVVTWHWIMRLRSTKLTNA